MAVQGRWNITAGQNTLFDTFDCQVHDFDSPKPNFLHGQLRWRIQKSNGDFISRAGEQTFNQVCILVCLRAPLWARSVGVSMCRMLLVLVQWGADRQSGVQLGLGGYLHGQALWGTVCLGR